MTIYSYRLEYDIAEKGAHETATSTGSDDPGSLSPPEDAIACYFTVESPPVRVSFDGEQPSPRHGLLLQPGEHFLPIAHPIRFVSAHEERPATISILWLRPKLTNLPEAA